MRGFRKRLLITNLVFAIIPFLLMSMILFYLFTQSVKEKLDNSMLANVEHSAKSLELKILTIDKYFNFILTNNRLQQILAEENLDDKNENIYYLMDELSKFFNSILYNDNLVNSCLVFPEKGGSYSTSNRNTFDIEAIKKSFWYKDILNEDGKVVWIGKVSDKELTYSNTFSYMVGAVIKDSVYNGRKTGIINIGTVILLLKRNFYSDIFTANEENSREINAILDSKGKVLYSNTKNPEDMNIFFDYIAKSNKNYGIASFNLDTGSTALFYARTETMEYSVLKIVPIENLTGRNNYIQYYMILLILFCISLLYLISNYISKKYSRPIVNIANTMERVGRSDFFVAVNENESDEIGVISRGFNSMVKEIRQLFQKVVEEEQEKRKAQIRALKYQINPHFIYNTLSGIRILVLKAGNEKAAEIIQCFGRLLRNTLSRTGELIPIKEEVDNIKNYISLQQMQYENRLDFEIDIDNNILNYKIPCMMLQPIVENSITHGLMEKLNSGASEAIIIIRGFIADSKNICFSVWDNGCGITKKRMDELFNKQDECEQEDSGQIGIHNIRQRIKLEFGEEYDITIESEFEEYTLVSITIPAINEEAREC